MMCLHTTVERVQTSNPRMPLLFWRCANLECRAEFQPVPKHRIRKAIETWRAFRIARKELERL